MTSILILISIYSYGQNLNQYFIDSKVFGSISIYDLNKQIWKHSNKDESERGTLPASTFKIIHTMIGLEEKVINDINDTIKWDGETKLFKTHRVPNWNRDNDLELAFRNSTIWYYEEISKQIKKDKYCKYLKKNSYSNRKYKNGKGFDFWNYGSLKVTPIEQIELLIRLYHNKLSFTVEHQEITKFLMIEHKTPYLTIRSKTGWCYEKKDIGWYVGYVELENNVIFFATRIEKGLDEEVNGFSKLRLSITKSIISDMYNLELNE